MIQKKYLIFIAPLILLFSLPFIFVLTSTEKSYGMSTHQTVADFELLNVEGQPHKLSDHRGHYVYLYFGYINCDDVCHNQVGVMFNIHHQSHFDDIDFVFVTIDPERDSKALLKEYFNQFGPNFNGLTASSQKQVQKVAAQFKEYFFNDASDSKNDYEVSHPGTIFLIDPQGNLKRMYRGQFLRYDFMINDLKQLKNLT